MMYCIYYMYYMTTYHMMYCMCMYQYTVSTKYCNDVLDDDGRLLHTLIPTAEYRSIARIHLIRSLYVDNPWKQLSSYSASSYITTEHYDTWPRQLSVSI